MPPHSRKKGAANMLTELTELCQEIRNWFDRERNIGTFTISGGNINASFLLPGQYYRIIGSIFNDGIHQYPSSELTDEVFDGAVWALAIPAPVIKLATEINVWREKNEAEGSANMSPFQSESFGGYSYSKGGSGGSDGTSGSPMSWKDAFRSRLNAWRKL